MGWFFNSRAEKVEKAPPCRHHWVVTEALHVTLRNQDLYILPEVNQTNVSRICKRCLKKEYHTVNGHIDHSKAFDIYGGPDEI